MPGHKDKQGKELDEVPANLILLYARARAYQLYVSGLKSGKRSGISEMFGNAEDIFSDNIDLPPTPVVDLSTIEEGTKDDRQWRALHLVTYLRASALTLFKRHVDKCRQGAFGKETQKAAESKISKETVDTILKEICSVYVYMIGIEQGVFSEESPEWLQEFVALAMSVIDMEFEEGKTVEEILAAFDQCEVEKLSQKLASSTGRHLGFGSVGETAWNDLRKQFLFEGSHRFTLYSNSMRMSIPEILKQLDA